MDPRCDGIFKTGDLLEVIRGLSKYKFRMTPKMVETLAKDPSAEIVCHDPFDDSYKVRLKDGFYYWFLTDELRPPADHAANNARYIDKAIF